MKAKKEPAYVRLLDEAVDVWRPIEVARFLGGHVVSPELVVPDGETWEFGPGEPVGLSRRRFSGGEWHVIVVSPV